MNPYTKRKQEAERARLESRKLWADASAWPTDTPTHVFVARAVNVIADRDQINRNAAQLHLREHCQYGRITAAIMDDTGGLLPILATAWNTDKFRDWFQTCRTEITVADGQVWRGLWGPTPLYWLFIEKAGLEAIAAPQASQTRQSTTAGRAGFKRRLVELMEASPNQRTISKDQQIEIGIGEFNLSGRDASSVRDQALGDVTDHVRAAWSKPGPTIASDDS